MNREIKFRGIESESGKWRYGYYVHFLYKINDETVGHNYRDFIIYEQDDYTCFAPVKPETVGQYTGLKDKNGKEIYEGDIIESGINTHHLIRFNDEEGSYNAILLPENKYRGLCGPIYQKWIDEFGNTITGNIYDNTELLEKE